MGLGAGDCALDDPIPHPGAAGDPAETDRKRFGTLDASTILVSLALVLSKGRTIETPCRSVRRMFYQQVSFFWWRCEYEHDDEFD